MRRTTATKPRLRSSTLLAGVTQNAPGRWGGSTQSCSQGQAEAQHNLGGMYNQGQGVPQNFKEALVWYRKAADQGDADAQFNLGAMYDQGQGVPQNFKEALLWYRKAADQGDAGAQCNLGAMYANGKGVPQNFREALVWHRKAADQGHAGAQFLLGQMYEEGQGVPKSAARALSWYRKAASQGFKEALDRVAELEAIRSSSGLEPGGCANCGALQGPDVAALKPCARCKVVVYCGKECQKKHWKAPGGHQGSCSTTEYAP